MLKKINLLAVCTVGFFMSSNSAMAWGGRGHHTICDAAVFLVKDEHLKEFLKSRGHVMGHLCNIPDIYWRSLPKNLTQEGNPSHFLDSEIIPLPLRDIPENYSGLVNQYNGQKTTEGKEIQFFPHEYGSLWWRADQFFRLAIAGADVLKKAVPEFKLEKVDEQNENNPYNKAVYNFYVNLGIMGHFVGDDSMPFHVSHDYDGYEKGHGGIHSYYEDGVISNFDEDLLARVVAEARKLQSSKRPEPYMAEGSVVQKMKALGLLSYADIDKLLKADTLIKASEVKDDGDKKKKVPAEREAVHQNFKKFEKLAILHLARAAALLAQLWDSAYDQVGKPNLKSYKSYKYPITPEFVVPDYYPLKEVK
jgi:hypothetical protein